jgi:outer membrane protein assembly factor BamB
VPLAAAGVPSWGCVTTQGPATGQSPVVLVCEVVDASATEMLGTTTSAHATAVHVVVLDPRTGTVLRRLPADVQASFATIGADVVRATWSGYGVDVTRLDPRTGRTVWTMHLTLDSRDLGTVRPVWVQGLGRGLLVQADSHAWELDPTGGVVAVVPAQPPAGEWEYFRTAGGDMVRFGFPAPQTSGDLTYTDLATGATFTPPAARPPWHGVDDGSAPNVLLSLGSTMTAWDLRTGQQLWHSEGSMTTAMILNGTVYSVGAGTVHAQDAQTGHALWSVDTKTRGANDLATDGRTLPVLTGNDAATSTLRSLDLTDGSEQWQTSLPAAAQSLEVITGRLFATTLDGVEALG